MRTTCCRYVLTVCKYWAQSNVFRTYGRATRGSFPRVPRYGLLYLRTVEHDHTTGPSTYRLWVHTYSKLFSCKFVLTICTCSYGDHCNESYTYGRVSRRSLPRVCRYGLLYYNDVIMSAKASQITSVSFFTQSFVQAQIKENIKAPLHWPLWGKFTGDRWIPHTKGQ